MAAEATQADYMVVARRYRPQQFGELVGQEPVAKALTNALKSGRVAHAYLFTGARGVGKTSAARILAKALNCVKGPTPKPCDACESCISIATGEDIDVAEIDGASNNGVDAVRELRQNVLTRPTRGKFKIYIIDEVHMLTGAAFNALLKTLEEPPAHVKFIFATTEVQKIPITILSRCQRFDFAGISSKLISERLKGVVKAEQMSADEEALQIVARRAGGSMRDAQSLLEQLLAGCTGKLTVDVVHSLLGTATSDRVIELVEGILKNDPAKALVVVQSAADQGLQLGELLDQLIDYWRGMMLVACGGQGASDVTLSESHRQAVTPPAPSISLDLILAGLDILSTTKARLRFSSQSLLLLEMAVIRLARLEDLVPVQQLIQAIKSGNPLPTIPIATKSDSVGITPLPAKKNDLMAEVATVEVVPTSVVKPIIDSSKEEKRAPASLLLNAQTADQVWPGVLEDVGMILGRQLEKAGLPAILGPNALAIRFSARYNTAYEQCREVQNLARLEATLKQMTGQPWTVRLEVEAPTIKDLNRATEVDREPSRNRKAEVLATPLIRRAVEKLGARFLQMDDDFGQIRPRSVEGDLGEAEDT
jgi:DNA polymerase III subunit gamma/tau